jgi:sec-independent protein translocase protein TatA
MPVIGLIGGLGAPELGLILVLVLIFVGPGKLPQVFGQFGKALKSFRDGQRDEPKQEAPGELTDHEGVVDVELVSEKASDPVSR